ncbi:MAG TPA: efflux RND transporter periplasmic adaptor subunit [Steroidobacteraceae bacterium]|nr:efflux RND transporter periplasmic adaptor subunit [Steroidobacteraceae bacterium]
MRITRGTLWLATAAAALVALSAIALRPQPVAVEVGTVSFGSLEVTEEDQAETRSHDRYVVAAPVAGRLLRVLLRDGDSVTDGQAVATLAPVPLSRRERDEGTARVDAAAAALRAAQAQLQHALEDLAQARREEIRLQALVPQGLASTQALDQARTAVTTLGMEVTAARNRGTSAAAELRGARAALTALAATSDGRAAPGTYLTLYAPAAGKVLRVIEQSERVLPSGAPVLIIGDLAHLEVVMEMLSSQAVRVSPGMPALLLAWGGDHPIRARVRLVEPYAFTKISALGVEEKRTNVILDFVDPPGDLGDGYRVIARITVWSSPHVLQAPLSAIFRCGSDWCVFELEGGRAKLRHIRIGHQNEEVVEVLSGLEDGEKVIRHPPNELADGARVSVQP